MFEVEVERLLKCWRIKPEELLESGDPKTFLTYGEE